MSTPPHRPRLAALAPMIVIEIAALVGVQLATVGASISTRHPHPATSRVSRAGSTATRQRAEVEDRRATPVAPAAPAPPPPVTPTTQSPSPPPPPPPPTTTPTTAPAPSAPATNAAVQPLGQATMWGCAAALSYLEAYAAPGFTLECPGNAEGRQAMTCINEPGVCTNARVIAIADACPAAYMNEASNSWVLTGRSRAPIDPFGWCP